jgi:hypothetical protein
MQAPGSKDQRGASPADVDGSKDCHQEAAWQLQTVVVHSGAEQLDGPSTTAGSEQLGSDHMAQAGTPVHGGMDSDGPVQGAVEALDSAGVCCSSSSSGGGLNTTVGKGVEITTAATTCHTCCSSAATTSRDSGAVAATTTLHHDGAGPCTSSSSSSSRLQAEASAHRHFSPPCNQLAGCSVVHLPASPLSQTGGTAVASRPAASDGATLAEPVSPHHRNWQRPERVRHAQASMLASYSTE